MRVQIGCDGRVGPLIADWATGVCRPCVVRVPLRLRAVAVVRYFSRLDLLLTRSLSFSHTRSLTAGLSRQPVAVPHFIQGPSPERKTKSPLTTPRTGYGVARFFALRILLSIYYLQYLYFTAVY